MMLRNLSQSISGEYRTMILSLKTKMKKRQKKKMIRRSLMMTTKKMMSNQ
jgi:hypothetical protein